MERDFKESLAPLGITRGAYAVLSAIHHDKKTRPAEISTFLGLDGAAITRHLDRVEQLGLIERKQDENDRRSTVVNLTVDGRRVVKHGLNGSKATNEKFTADLTSDEIDCFQTAIRAMLAKSDIAVADF
jgi:DNA-binding MarR family transcriptional regulator